MIQKCAPVSKRFQQGEELQIIGVKGFDQILQKQTAKQLREHSDGQEKTSSAGNPLGAIRGKTTAGDHTVKVRMMKQILAPGVKHGKKADLGAQMFGISSDGA